ncbi:MAG TPA: LytTR family transcriptional regulator DNA-binding domain-containing protein [Longimicrobiaceae bacterium]|nr:LytTR family transcriptional regulator DNA-binding domain-containing protein [Longimicrobiaceae bacterium]
MIRALIVDDEPLARRGIRLCLGRAGDVEVVGECGSGREAVRAIEDLAPDLVFLDVQMPGLDGFGVVEAVGPDRMPPVVFVTAYDQHAIRAFDAQALDYLLKPIDDDRFDRALERARRSLAERRELNLGRRLTAAMAELGVAEVARPAGEARRHAGRFLVKKAGRVVLVGADEIDWVEAAGDYVRLHAGRESHLLRETMARMEEQLDPERFVRIHRSTIVNVQRIRELQPYFNRDHVVILLDGTRLRLSRSYVERLEERFGGRL